MQQVAERAGVSTATVSFVVNNTKTVRDDTRRRVERAISDLGYRRNASARALASQRTHLIALAHQQLGGVFSPTLLEFIAAASSTAKSLGYHLVLVPTDHDGEELSALIGEGLVDGALLMGVLLDDPRVPRLQELDATFAMIGRNSNPEGLAYVDIDIDETVKEAFDHLEGLGHSEIVLISERSSRRPGAPSRSREAFQRMGRQRGLHVLTFECDRDARAGKETARRVMREHPETTAFVMHNERAAFGIVAGLRQLGHDVPADVSVISMSTTPAMGGLVDPPLTILHVPGTQLGELGIRALVDLLEGRPQPEPALIACELEINESTSVARGPRTGFKH